jgi:hypothetical protein
MQKATTERCCKTRGVMARSLDEVIAALPADERVMIAARVEALIAEETLLQALSKVTHQRKPER